MNDHPPPLPRTWWAAAALVFALIATLNAGGYRFGVADQAFYLPAIQRHLDPASFPRDRVLLDDQDRLNVFTAAAAAVSRTTGAPLPVLFAGVYVLSLLLLATGAGTLARRLGASPWAVAGGLAALTLRHRVGITGANTLESYGHPRLLAFAIGVWAVAALLRRRTAAALLLVAVAFVVHPTTALWFGVWVGLAGLVSDRRARPWLAAAGLLALGAAAWAVTAGPLSAQLVRMDAEWLGVLGSKDYLFPDRWPISGWLMAALYASAVVAPARWRQQRGLLVEGEAGMVAGLLGLLGLFIISVPLTASGVAIAVQFQVSRVFWMCDLAGTVYVVWLLVDGYPASRPGRAAPRWTQYAALTLLVAGVLRGAYVKWIEHPERPVARLELAPGDWHDAMAWLARTPIGTHVLADPGHAWKYGTSVRVAAGRDVLLEEMKDTAMSMYSRRTATHVLERIRAIGDFGALTLDAVRTLDARYGIDYLVAEQPFDLPVAHRAGRFTVYRLD
jgi:hypothetical protein